jgi:hypothetical protein
MTTITEPFTNQPMVRTRLPVACTPNTTFRVHRLTGIAVTGGTGLTITTVELTPGTEIELPLHTPVITTRRPSRCLDVDYYDETTLYQVGHVGRLRRLSVTQGDRSDRSEYALVYAMSSFLDLAIACLRGGRPAPRA